MEDAAVIRAVRYVETDKDGHFLVDHLPWGSYKIHTRKDSAGYPNTASTFYNEGLSPTIMLSQQVPSASLTVKLGPKAGVVQGSVTDSVTGLPIDASVHLWRIANPSHWLDKTLPSHYVLLIPANVTIGMEVTAQGYLPWYYPGTSAPGGALIETPGESARIDITLIPEVKPH